MHEPKSKRVVCFVIEQPSEKRTTNINASSERKFRAALVATKTKLAFKYVTTFISGSLNEEEYQRDKYGRSADSVGVSFTLDQQQRNQSSLR